MELAFGHPDLPEHDFSSQYYEELHNDYLVDMTQDIQKDIPEIPYPNTLT